jgi:hypothetical protein
MKNSYCFIRANEGGSVIFSANYAVVRSVKGLDLLQKILNFHLKLLCSALSSHCIVSSMSTQDFFRCSKAPGDQVQNKKLH